MRKIDEIGRLMAQGQLFYADWAKRQGINYNLLAVFYSIQHYPQCTQKQICDAWALPKQTVFSLCKKLKEEGIVVFEQESVDKREKIVRFTEQGADFSKPILAKLAKIEQATIVAFGETNLEQFIQQLQQLNQIIQQQIQNENQE